MEAQVLIYIFQNLQKLSPRKGPLRKRPRQKGRLLWAAAAEKKSREAKETEERNAKETRVTGAREARGKPLRKKLQRIRPQQIPRMLKIMSLFSNAKEKPLQIPNGMHYYC